MRRETVLLTLLTSVRFPSTRPLFPSQSILFTRTIHFPSLRTLRSQHLHMMIIPWTILPLSRPGRLSDHLHGCHTSGAGTTSPSHLPRIPSSLILSYA